MKIVSTQISTVMSQMTHLPNDTTGWGAENDLGHLRPEDRSYV